jgi:hypothetical protein
MNRRALSHNEAVAEVMERLAASADDFSASPDGI